MHITKKIDRAFQWAGEKMGGEAKTTMSDDFKMLETEMALRHDGMDRLQKSMSAYVKWLGRRGETFEDKEKGLPVAYLGRTMVAHGEDFEPDSEFGNCLITMGRANERVAAIQESYVADATTLWLESLERSLAMMKEYQASRKKLESRRLAYDATMAKLQKARRDDFRIEEELRTAKAKYEESSEDVVRRMQDIKDTEAESMRDLTGFLDAELDYHERCAEELRRIRHSGAFDASSSGGYSGGASLERRGTRSRSNTQRSHNSQGNGLSLSRVSSHRDVYDEPEPEPAPVRMAIRSNSSISRAGANGYLTAESPREAPIQPTRPSLSRSSTFQGGAGLDRRASAQQPLPPPNNIGSLRGQLRPVSTINTRRDRDTVFGDRDEFDTASGSGSPEWGERSASPATSFGSLSRSTSNVAVSAVPMGATNGGGLRKAPPPPPPSRSKKPPPPLPVKREIGGY